MLEYEFKVLLTKEKYENLSRSFKWSKTFKQVNYYYSDKNGISITNNITIRIRKIKNEYFLQVKEPVKKENALSVKKEKECIVDGVYDIIPTEILNKLLVMDLKEVALVGELETERKVNNEYEKTEIVLDKNTYLGIVDYELEVEYQSGADIEQILNLLKEKYKISFNFPCIGKKSRFFRQYQKKS